MKGWSKLLEVRDMQTKNTMRYNFSPIRLGKLKSQKILNFGEIEGKWGEPYTAVGV